MQGTWLVQTAWLPDADWRIGVSAFRIPDTGMIRSVRLEPLRVVITMLHGALRRMVAPQSFILGFLTSLLDSLSGRMQLSRNIDYFVIHLLQFCVNVRGKAIGKSA